VSTLPDSIRSLILDEQARLDGQFIDGDLEAYLARLAERAEMLSDSAAGRCRGFVAFYCNDEATRQAYITLVLVDPKHRGTGLGRSLVAGVLDIARRRGFTSCRLEVAKRNAPAYAMYLSMGFGLVEDRGGKDLLEIAL
jgi:ribosomal protein S18 acetylase RimI-like enzyme